MGVSDRTVGTRERVKGGIRKDVWDNLGDGFLGRFGGFVCGCGMAFDMDFDGIFIEDRREGV